MSAEIAAGIVHAIYTFAETEITSVFGDGDQREDRERISI